jgi:hypothetical protein
MTTSQTIDPADRAPAPAIPFEPATLRPRHDGWTAERQIRFIEAVAATKCVDEACRIVGMSDTSAYELRNRPCGAAFARAWDLALELKLDRVEQAAIERSINGVVRPIFYKGEQVGEYRHYDERLTMFLLRSRRPQRYGKSIEHSPAPEPDERDRRFAFGDALMEIGITAPTKDGNPVEGWSEDGDDDAADLTRPRVGQQTWQTFAPPVTPLTLDGSSEVPKSPA